MTIRSYLLTAPFILVGGLAALPASASVDPAALRLGDQAVTSAQSTQVLVADKDKKEKKEKKEKNDKNDKHDKNDKNDKDGKNG